MSQQLTLAADYLVRLRNMMAEVSPVEYSSADDETKRRIAFYVFLLESGESPEWDDTEPDSFGEFCNGRESYLVLSGDEANAAARDYIADSLWAFNPSFLARETGFDDCIFKALANRCEDANDAVRKLVDASCGLDSLIDEAVACDGRGHFLNSCDGTEHEVCVNGDYWCIYREN